MEAKKSKKQDEQIEILDESTGQIRVKYQHSDLDFSKQIEQTQFNLDYDLATTPTTKVNHIPHQPQLIQIIEDTQLEISTGNDNLFQQVIGVNNIKQHRLINSGFSDHIVQNYSILAQEIATPLVDSKHMPSLTETPHTNDFLTKQWLSNPLSTNPKTTTTKSSNQTNLNNNNQNARSSKDSATCQFCGLAMLKKNIPTHIRRAHTPKEELVCLNEEQNIFTFNYLKPGQRRKRSARAYDYSLMTATVSIDDDSCDGIENKFITEGEEILSTDLNQLADRIKYGITQIPMSTLTKLIDILAKIEYSTQDEVCANAKSIRNMICYFISSGEEFKYKIRQVSEDIVEKKKAVGNLRADLKEVMSRKANLERRIQPLICDLQKLEDQHGNLIESIVSMNNLIQCDILQAHDDIVDI